MTTRYVLEVVPLGPAYADGDGMTQDAIIPPSLSGTGYIYASAGFSNHLRFRGEEVLFSYDDQAGIVFNVGDDDRLRYHYGSDLPGAYWGDNPQVVMIGLPDGAAVSPMFSIIGNSPPDDLDVVDLGREVDPEQAVLFSGETMAPTVELSMESGTRFEEWDALSMLDGSPQRRHAGYFYAGPAWPASTSPTITRQVPDIETNTNWRTYKTRWDQSEPLPPGRTAQLRYRQRNDGVRQGRSSSSKQASTRQGSPNTYL